MRIPPQNHDLTLPAWGPYTKKYSGISHIPAAGDGVRFERAVDLEKGSATLRPEHPVKAVRIVSTCDDNGTPYVTIQPPQVLPRL